ncbi:MAG: sigma-70 family RNA polymerase sigma factor [Oscillospiraceae bacterium]|nr:sigma-70 family RNA polymerase sigma factor [Oscillospiraceae bacterium]
MRLETEIVANRYRDRLFAAALSICRNPADADDAVQDTLLQYHTAQKEFESEAHIRAWLLRVAINRAKNITLSFWRRSMLPLEQYAETLSFETAADGELFHEVMHLPEKYRIVIHLFYYEDYSVREIAGILKLKESTVRVRLMRGRKLLKEALKEEWSDDDE